MWRTISYYLRVICNFVYLPILSLLNGFRIRFSIIQKISLGTELSIGKQGLIKIKRRCTIEKGTRVRAGNYSEIILGEKVYINRNCTIVSHSKIIIGDKTTIGPNACIFDHDHDFRNKKGFISKPIIIGENVWIGANVTILKGVTIGDNSVIGAGAIITKDIPSGVIVKNENKYSITVY